MSRLRLDVNIKSVRVVKSSTDSLEDNKKILRDRVLSSCRSVVKLARCGDGV